MSLFDNPPLKKQPLNALITPHPFKAEVVYM
jgi:hypothetical protein